jgi:transposase
MLLNAAGSDTTIQEAAADKGYHAASTIELNDSLDVRTYIPEPQRKHRLKLSNKSKAEQQAIRNNRRRMQRSKGKALQRRRSEVVERTFAHMCETGGSRRSHLRGLVNVTKRYVIAAAAHNLGRILRKLTGIGKPRCLQGGGGLAALARLVLKQFRRAPKNWLTWLGLSIRQFRRYEQFPVIRLAT